MSEQLKNLLNKIKSEGIQAAEDRAREIESDAQKEAENIVGEAKKQAKKIIGDAKADTQKMKKSGEASLKQASRDLMLSVKNEIKKVFDKIIIAEVDNSLNTKELTSILNKLIEKYAQKNAQNSDIKVLLNKEDLKKLEDTFIAKLKTKFKEKIEFKPASDVNAGFVISFDKGSSYYEFTDEALAECLSSYLNEKLSELLKDSASKKKK